MVPVSKGKLEFLSIYVSLYFPSICKLDIGPLCIYHTHSFLRGGTLENVLLPDQSLVYPDITKPGLVASSNPRWRAM